MWSENRTIDIAINVLMFLLGINFLHLGQFILPIICIILFFDRKFQFKVNDIKVFVSLILLAITLFIFSYKEIGFYSVMGFTLPMAYYIGSNIKNNSEENIKQLIYIIAFGMMIHMFLNMVLDFKTYGFEFLLHKGRFDIWTRDVVSSTTLAVNYTLYLGILVYLFLCEKNKRIKILNLVVFIFSIIYSIALGRRMILIISFCSIVSALFVYKKNHGIEKNILNKFIKIFACFILVIIVLTISYFLIPSFKNAIQDYVLYNPLVQKLVVHGLTSGRLEILFSSLKIYPKHLWGGYSVSKEVGEVVHDLWGDIYNVGGIIPYILIIYWTIMSFGNILKNIKNKKYSNDFLVIVIPYLIAAFLQMIVEPIYSGSSLFLICVIIINTSLENKLNF